MRLSVGVHVPIAELDDAVRAPRTATGHIHYECLDWDPAQRVGGIWHCLGHPTSYFLLEVGVFLDQTLGSIVSYEDFSPGTKLRGGRTYISNDSVFILLYPVICETK